MIHSDELMIGNWIMEGPEPNTIYSLDQGGVSFFQINDQRVNKNGDDIRFRPIPLTPEILEKAGFTKDGDMWYRTDSGISTNAIYIEDDWSIALGNYETAGFYCSASNRCQYVHQLQNLYFALTGQHLKIEL